MKKLLFIKPQPSSFIQSDELILKKHFQVKSFEYGTKQGIHAIFSQIRLFFWLLLHFFSAEIVYLWFADYYGFFPILFCKVFGKKSIVVIGGFDAIKAPEFNYGGHLKPFRSKIIKYICKNASVLLPVSDYTKTKLEENCTTSFSHKSKVIHNCIDTDFYEFKDNSQKRNLVVTVCGTEKKLTAKLKGLYEFAEAARNLPEIEFLIVGLTGNAYAEFAGKEKNLKVIGRVAKPELLEIYHQAKVVCQLSYIESFGVALGEAMCCHCVPITMAGIGASEIVSPSCGYVLTERNPQETATTIRNAIEQADTLGKLAAERIANAFTPAHREKQLLAIL